MFKAMERACASNYSPQVNESYGQDLPPPAYPKAVPTSLRLAKIVSTTILILALLLGIFILTGIFIRTSNGGCDCDTIPSGHRRLDREGHFEPLVAMASEEKPVREESPDDMVPLQLQLNKGAQELVDKNRKAHMNCVVEKRKATQTIANQPKLVITPYGNITSDPGVIQMVGEKMVISCQTGIKRTPAKLKGDHGVRRRSPSSKEELCDCNCAC